MAVRIGQEEAVRMEQKMGAVVGCSGHLAVRNDVEVAEVVALEVVEVARKKVVVGVPVRPWYLRVRVGLDVGSIPVLEVEAEERRKEEGEVVDSRLRELSTSPFV